MASLSLIATQLPLNDEPLPVPQVVATITCDARFLGHLKPAKLLGRIADKMGLVQYAIIDGADQHIPGYQLPLFH